MSKRFGTLRFSIILFLTVFLYKNAVAFTLDTSSVFFTDPLVKVFKYSKDLPVAPATADVALGENATFQLVFHADKKVVKLSADIVSIKNINNIGIKNGDVRFVGYVLQGRYAEHPATDVIRSKDRYFPDPLLEDNFVAVNEGDNQAIWLTIPISTAQAPGSYKGTVAVNLRYEDGTERKINKNFIIVVYPVNVSKRTLWVSNWAAILNPAYLPIANPEKVEMYSDAYWDGITKLAEKFKNYRQNVVRLEVIKMISYSRNGSTYKFDFSRMDKMINIFLNNGIKRIEGDFVGEKLAGWDGPIGFVMPADNGAATNSRKLIKVKEDDSNAKDFYTQYLPALYEHLKSKGWQNIYFQHISDEPTLDNPKGYKALLQFVRKVEPRLKVIEAINQPVPEDIEIQVPLLSYLRYGGINRFEAQQKRTGCELWFYICVSPQYNYPNRFLETPLIKTRILHWDNFKYNLTGFLHWGYNIWGGYPFDFSKSSSVGGDAWIVYPKNGKILSSIRLEAMRDGIVDYELLKLLEKTNPALARKIVDGVVFDFDKVNTNISSFRSLRKSILVALSH